MWYTNIVRSEKPSETFLSFLSNLYVSFHRKPALKRAGFLLSLYYNKQKEMVYVSSIKASLAGCSVFLIVCVIFVVLGFKIDNGSRHTLKTRTSTTNGEIIEVYESIRENIDDNGYRTETTTYRNKYKYTVDGEEYYLEDSKSSYGSHQIGDKVTIHYDPNAPADAISENMIAKNSVNGRIAMGCGLWGLAIFALICYSAVRPMLKTRKRHSQRYDIDNY